MSRCCVVKVITLTEIQLLQVGEMTYLQPRDFEAMTHTEENIVLNSMCAFVCTQDTFAVTARLTMEAPGMGLLLSVRYPSLIFPPIAQSSGWLQLFTG